MTKIMGKTDFWLTFCFYPLPSELSYVMGSQHCIGERRGGEGWWEGGWRGGLNRLFKITIIFCHRLSEMFQKNKKNEVLRMLFQVTQICFNEPDYVTLHSIMNIMTENGAKMTHKMTQ